MNQWNIIMLGLLLSAIQTFAQSKPAGFDAYATLSAGELRIGNSAIERVFVWNGGHLLTKSLTDKGHAKTWSVANHVPDLILPGESQSGENATFEVHYVPANQTVPQHIRAEIIYSLGTLDIKRVYRVYSECPAIACELYYKGSSRNNWVRDGVHQGDQVNIEKLTSSKESIIPVIEYLNLPGRHWQLRAVEFFDITDRFNNLVKEVDALSYRLMSYHGNLLFAFDKQSRQGIFFLKEAPASHVQLAYPGGDFLTEYGSLKMIGAGISPDDLDTVEWKRGYGFVTGVYSQKFEEGLKALRNYQKNVRLLKADRDEMIMMNTWGDRAQDTRLGEKFALAELEAGGQLGITHFQLDDGWQQGISANSAFEGGSFKAIWNNPRYWDVNLKKFPNDLYPILEKAKQRGIKIGLWFNPSADDDNADWEKDADRLIYLYKKYGVSTFKIDGVKLPTKAAEHNFRKMLDKVNQYTDNNVVFNLDVTANRRGGYHYFNEYGNLFLENRYTDWQNYYPYTTLRNLWMLSQYVPAEKIQIEFLNKWRNVALYADDPYRPDIYSFEYLFAITMAAQPLAWFEGSKLPSDAIKEIAPVINKYLNIQHDFHQGYIFPIGDEPSGNNWTGFQSFQDKRGYFIVFRENNDSPDTSMTTWLQEGINVNCKLILGKGNSFKGKVGEDGKLKFALPDKNSYALYSYTIND